MFTRCSRRERVGAYGNRVRDFFEELGLPSIRGKTVQGVRTRHRVDVLVEFERFGVPQKWVVECKHWKRRVEKSHVLTLQGVVVDVGADRGFLLSESDFQSGAVAAARYSNITLSNLSDLRDNAAADLNEHRWNVLLRRHVALWEWNFALSVRDLEASDYAGVAVRANRALGGST
jgi:restriction system protein